MTDPTIRDYLANHRFFENLDEEYLDFLARCATMRKIKKNEMLFRQRQVAETFYVLQRGRISVEIPAMYGPHLRIQNLGPGQILGWSWFIPPYDWDFQARAEEDSELLEFDGKAVLARCEEDAEFGYALLKRFTVLMSDRLEAARRRMMDEFSPAGFA